MSRTPYRRPSPPSNERPRGPVARQPGGPELAATPSARDTIRAFAAAEAARLERVAYLSPRLRIVGLIALAIGLALAWLTLGDIEAGVRAHPVRILVASSTLMLCGAWIAAVGMGGGEPGEPNSPARWVLWGLGVAGIFGPALNGWLFDLLVALAG